jgi:hypothetical protein
MSRDGHSSRRRTVLAGLVTGAAALAGCSGPDSGESDGGTATPTEGESEGEQQGQQGEEEVPQIKLGGRADGWVGVQPEGIEDQQNPTLTLQADTPYEIVWENLDGKEHELLIVDGNDEELAASEAAESKGETVTMQITASEEMEQYYCEYHPEQMRGEINIVNDG